MPIEIKELNIKINVSENLNTPEPVNTGMNKELHDNIVNLCVEQVMEIISKTHER